VRKEDCNSAVTCKRAVSSPYVGQQLLPPTVIPSISSVGSFPALPSSCSPRGYWTRRRPIYHRPSDLSIHPSQFHPPPYERCPISSPIHTLTSQTTFKASLLSRPNIARRNNSLGTQPPLTGIGKPRTLGKFMTSSLWRGHMHSVDRPLSPFQ
jgi:hypothetical protein